MARKKTQGTPEGEAGATDSRAQAAAAEQAAEAQAQTAEEKAGADESGKGGKEYTQEEIIKLYIEQMKNEIARLSEENAKLTAGQEEKKAESEQYQQKLANLSSEYENYRRRTVAEKEGIYAEAVVKAVTNLLPALDSLEKAVEYAQQNPQNLEQGVQMTLKQLSDGFAAIGVSEIEAQSGAKFNPDLHNAVMHIEDDARGESEIVDVFQKGYQIGDKVIRHSVVRVAN